jgi:CRP/FNR family cyclic AMP-dependent transcriptional regulator
MSNYHVSVASNGKAGLAMAIEQQPDLIICDILMPVLDGYGVLHAIQKHEKTRNTPFIFLTAKTERAEMRKGMDLGADDYITKPFSATELLNAVDSRLKKIDIFKHDLLPAPDGSSRIMELSTEREVMESLTEGRVIIKYKKKQVIYLEGNHPNKLYYVMKGKVKAYKGNEEGKELVTDLYHSGDFLGYVALLEGALYRDTAEAMEPTELALIPREDFEELMNMDPEVSRKFIRLLARNISSKEEQLLRLAYNSLRKKVADALLLLCQGLSEINEGPLELEISRENLATIAGTATESLIRTLSDFKLHHIIDIREGKILILDRGKLEHMVN